jgi:isoleucyl-tRNA synthetase
MLAPLTVFTADEIWENLPQASSSSSGGGDGRLASVHLTELPRARSERDAEMASRWEKIFAVRDLVLRALEEARIAKVIGSSLEARVNLSASGQTYDLLEKYLSDLRYIFIVSQVNLEPAERASGATEMGGVAVKVERAAGEKCERCWNYSTRVGESSRYPTVCERCVQALDEIEREEAE